MTDGAPTRSLEYAPRPPLRRRLVRPLLLLMLVAVAALSARWGPALFHQLQAQLAERRLLRFEAPVGTVALTNDPAECATLFATGQHVLVPIRYIGSGMPYPEPVAGFAPPALDVLQPGATPRGYNRWESPGPTGPAPTLFLHALRAHGEPTRLVHVRPELSWDYLAVTAAGSFVSGPWQRYISDEQTRNGPTDSITACKLTFSVTVYETSTWRPGSVMRPLTTTGWTSDSTPRDAFVVPLHVDVRNFGDAGEDQSLWLKNDRIRLLAARPDPKDDARFIFDYVLDGAPGTITGELQADDTVAFAVVSGPLRRWPSTPPGR